MFLSNDKCVSTIKKLVEPTQHQLSFRTPSTISSNPHTVINRFHYHKPASNNVDSGRHNSIGQDSSKFNLHQAALASNRQRDNVMNTFLKVDHPSQRRYILGQFYSHKSIIEDTKYVLQDQLMTKEARAGMTMLRSMKSIIKKKLRCSVGCISNGQQSFVYMMCACIHNCEDDNQLSDLF